jgi:NADPH-dependent 7-cyano-7-deazaguanine reductase QueF
MQPAVIIQALHRLLKPDNETVEDIYYNAGVIDAIKVVQKYTANKQNTDKKNDM